MKLVEVHNDGSNDTHNHGQDLVQYHHHDQDELEVAHPRLDGTTVAAPVHQDDLHLEEALQHERQYVCQGLEDELDVTLLPSDHHAEDDQSQEGDGSQERGLQCWVVVEVGMGETGCYF